jgi:hypothetical protein
MGMDASNALVYYPWYRIYSRSRLKIVMGEQSMLAVTSMSLRNWLNNAIIAPIVTMVVAGIVLSIFGIGIDRYKEKNKVVLYRVEEPFALIQIHKLFDEENISYEFEYQSISG